MKLNIDVAIIGGGTAGVAGALDLRKQGLTVAVFERHKIGSQASGVNYGGVRQQGRNSDELPLSKRSREIWEQLPNLIGSNCDFESTGHLKLARSEKEMEDLEQFSKLAAKHKLEIELLDHRSLRDRFPVLGESVIGASYCPSDGKANPRLVAPAFGRAALKAGALIFEEEGVTNALHSSTGFVIETEKGRKVYSRVLVNSSGAWGDTVAGWFDEHIVLEVKNPNMFVTAPMPYRLKVNIGVSGADFYVRQTDRGNLICGGGFGISDREASLSRPKLDVAQETSARLIDIIPFASESMVIRTWTGIEGFMPDSIPVIGMSEKIPELVHAFGFSGHGFQLGPVVGEIISELVTKGSCSLPIKPFNINRF